MGLEEIMTEDEFIVNLQKIGYKKAEIEELIETINLIKKTEPDFSYEKELPLIIETYKKYKDFPDDIYPLD